MDVEPNQAPGATAGLCSVQIVGVLVLDGVCLLVDVGIGV